MMNLALGLVLGSLVGWASFAILRMGVQRGVLTSVFLGAIGGAIGMQLASMVTGVPGIESTRGVFAVLMAAASASACLMTASMIASR